MQTTMLAVEAVRTPPLSAAARLPQRANCLVRMVQLLFRMLEFAECSKAVHRGNLHRNLQNLHRIRRPLLLRSRTSQSHRRHYWWRPHSLWSDVPR